MCLPFRQNGNDFIHMGTTLLKFYTQCRSKIIAFPTRGLFTLEYMRLILIYSVPKLPAEALERAIQAK